MLCATSAWGHRVSAHEHRPTDSKDLLHSPWLNLTEGRGRRSPFDGADATPIRAGSDAKDAVPTHAPVPVAPAALEGRVPASEPATSAAVGHWTESVPAPPPAPLSEAKAGGKPVAPERSPGAPSPTTEEKKATESTARDAAKAGAKTGDAKPSVPAVRVVSGVTIVGNGASAAAVDVCAGFITQMIGKNQFAQKQLAAQRLTLVIVPHDKKMTDLPQFAHLHGQHTFDGRVWDDVRGSGGTPAPDGSFAIAVPEENLTAIPGVKDSYGPGYNVGMHEFAHSLHNKGTTPAQRRRITDLYAARRRAGGPWTEAYGASNDQEYFAQSTNCYFGKNAGVGQNGRAWLQANDPPMFAFLEELYGQSFDDRGAIVPPPDAKHAQH